MTTKQQLTQLLAENAELRERMTLIEKVREELPEITKRGLPREDVWYEVLRVPETKTIQPQGIKCMVILMNKTENPSHVTEAEAMDMIREHRGYLKTTQDPWWKVFCFYRARLISMGCLRMHS